MVKAGRPSGRALQRSLPQFCHHQVAVPLLPASQGLLSGPEGFRELPLATRHPEGTDPTVDSWSWGGPKTKTPCGQAVA